MGAWGNVKYKMMTVKCKILSVLVTCAALTFGSTVQCQEINKIKISELEKIIKESKGPLIVNFWATFCVPCLQEIPHFQAVAEKYKEKGLTLLLVSLDMKDAYPKKIISIAKKLKLNPPFYWLDETNADYFCPKVDSSWSGALPASLFVNNATGYRKLFEEELSREKLEKQIMAILKIH